MPRRTRPGPGGWLDLAAVVVLRHVARRLPVGLKKAVLADAWRIAALTANAPVADAARVYLAYEQSKEAQAHAHL